jgi:epoxyqueuosine reductase QueG
MTSAEVKEKAVVCGAHLVGVASAEVVQRHAVPGSRNGPLDVLKGARSVVVVARRLLSGMSREVAWDNRNVHYAGEMILSSVEALTYEVVRFLEDHDFPSIMVPSAYSRSHQVDIATKALSLPHLAVEAGLGTLGLNLQLLTPEFGPRVVLGAVLTTAELEPDAMREQALCRGAECGRCLLACPGEAVGAWKLELERCRPYSSPYGYQFVERHVERILDAPDREARREAARSTETLMVWQSMLRGVGIYSGCTRCYDVCPVGRDYEAHLQDVQETIPEDTAEKRGALAAIQAEPPSPGLREQVRWIGRLGAGV